MGAVPQGARLLSHQVMICTPDSQETDLNLIDPQDFWSSKVTVLTIQVIQVHDRKMP